MRNGSPNRRRGTTGPALRHWPIALLLAALMLAGCGSGGGDGSDAAGTEDAGAEEATTAAGETYRVAFGFPFRMVDVYKPLIDAAKAEAERNGVELLESSAGISASEQLAEVNTWIGQGVDAIVLFSLEPDSLGPVVERAHEAGIKIIGYGENLPEQDGSIVFNNTQGAELIGQITGEYINDELGGEANLGVLSFLTGEQNRIRSQVAVETILEVAPGAEVVAEAQANDAATALEVGRPMLNQAPDINVVVANTDDNINGFQSALSAAGRDPRSVWFASYDASTPILQKMLNGEIIGVTAALPTADIGEAVVTAALNAITGEGETSLNPDYVAVMHDDTDLIEEILAERGAGG